MFFSQELWSEGAGLFAACFIAIVPGYISRSVAGSYDNEVNCVNIRLFSSGTLNLSGGGVSKFSCGSILNFTQNCGRIGAAVYEIALNIKT